MYNKEYASLAKKNLSMHIFIKYKSNIFTALHQYENKLKFCAQELQGWS